jgi:hypothetical protein
MRSTDCCAAWWNWPIELVTLLVLLEHPDASVAGWAGAHALEFTPDEGEPALVALTERDDGLIGFGAEITLEEWRAGRLSFP